MKAISRLFTFGFASLLLMTLITPSIVHAEGEQSRTKPQKTNTDKSSSEKVTQNAQSICANITGLSSRLGGQVDERRTKVEQDRNSRDTKRTEKRTELNQKLSDKRGEWDKKREENFIKLREKAKTDEQKAAVEAYIAAVTTAIAARRASVDSANQTFKQATDALTADSRADNSAEIVTFKAAVQTAIDKAIANCPVQGKVAMETMKAEIKTAREALKNSHKQDGALKDGIKSAQDARKASVEAAIKTFNQAMSTARTNLKAALKTA